MNKNPYMSKNELINWLKLAVLVGELDSMIENTKDSIWRKAMKTARTLLSKIVEERLSLVEIEQLLSVKRRREHASIYLQSTDEKRINAAWSKEDKYIVQIDQDTLYDLTDMALCTCKACFQGEFVKECRYRKTLHEFGIPVARDVVANGECEFRADNAPAIINPKNSPINERLEN